MVYANHAIVKRLQRKEGTIVDPLGQKFECRHNVFKSWWEGFARPITARCPMCEQEHVVSIWWVGRGQPRLYCSGCRLSIAKRDFDGDAQAYRDCYK